MLTNNKTLGTVLGKKESRSLKGGCTFTRCINAPSEAACLLWCDTKQPLVCDYNGATGRCCGTFGC